MVGHKRSLIKKFFSPELCLEIERIIMKPISNNVKGEQLGELIKERTNGMVYRIGTGTNRIGMFVDGGYVVKVALDKDGKIDNRREFRYSKILQPHVIKVYECDPEGLLAISEYVCCLSISEFQKYQVSMRNILSDISEKFLIGDVGINSKNYANWGRRTNGELCMLDFAYIYAISYRTFECTCNRHSILHYDENYVNLICPTCRRKFTFGQIRKRISKKQQEEEIGDLTELGYVLHSPEEEVELRVEAEPELMEAQKQEEKKESKRKPYAEELKRRRKLRRRINEDE